MDENNTADVKLTEAEMEMLRMAASKVCPLQPNGKVKPSDALEAYTRVRTQYLNNGRKIK